MLDGLRARGCVQLAIDGVDLALDGVRRDVKAAADLAKREMRRQEAQDPELGDGQRAMGRPAPRRSAPSSLPQASSNHDRKTATSGVRRASRDACESCVRASGDIGEANGGAREQHARLHLVPGNEVLRASRACAASGRGRAWPHRHVPAASRSTRTRRRRARRSAGRTVRHARARRPSARGDQLRTPSPVLGCHHGRAATGNGSGCRARRPRHSALPLPATPASVRTLSAKTIRDAAQQARRGAPRTAVVGELIAASGRG